ncbi:MAG: hypothetical protein IH991_03625 [Planctomycetes bacterium]|nr:hypothetical protein [Planctomycetota bacterium]
MNYPVNKAHTATVHRIAERYSLPFNQDSGFDFRCDQFVIEVETTATLVNTVERLTQCDSVAYIAMTNMEGVHDAIQLTTGTGVGVMEPQGTIVKESAADEID